MATRSKLSDFIREPQELRRRSAVLFGKILDGVLKADAVTQRPLSEVVQAHADPEGRRSTGSVVLIP